jgi:hypothetical protein
VPQAIEDTQKSVSLVNKESSLKMHGGRLLAIEVIAWASMMAGATPAMAQDLRTLAQGHFTLPAPGALAFQHTTTGRLHT